ncbi:MAG: FKBP-type peptidyl-prolyl cis-trans isomerase [Fibrobacteraceae bacterium]|nr:FKBP-type peptidyl-prolyl cis-trans isomerase [Fibrobacteraceae bacterium]
MSIIQNKMKVSIAYVLKENGRILEEIPASHPFVYIHGYSNIITGLENALEGKKIGDRFSVDIPCEIGYGKYRDDLVLNVPKEELRDIGELWLGMELEMFQDNDIREFQLPDNAEDFFKGLNLENFDDNEENQEECEGIYTIKEILKDTVIVDGNHPFAGKNLSFDVEIVDIEEPSFTELETGVPDEADDEFDDDYNNKNLWN